MSDAGAMDAISMQEEVDPVFHEVAGLLFGDAVDSRELFDIAKMDDASEVHVTRGLSAKERKRRKRQAQIGLASNIVGIGAGGVALGSAARDPRLAEGGKVARAISRTASKLPEVTPKHGRAGALVAGGALGLQLGNTAGDLVANRVLNREAKKKVSKDVSKALSEIVAARRAGQITTETAVEMSSRLLEEVEKGLLPKPPTWMNPRAIGRMVNQNMANPVPQRMARRKAQVAGMNPAVRASRRQAATRQMIEDAPKAKRAALVATGATAATAGAFAGARRATKKERESLGKSAELVEYAYTGEISKTDEDKRLAFGWASLSTVDGQPVVDLQGDYAPIEEIEKSAYAYVVTSRVGGDMHAREGERPKHTSDLVESFIATPEKLQKMGISEEVAKSVPTGWWVGFKVNDDEQWAMVKDGRRAGFSIHGKGSRVQKALED